MIGLCQRERSLNAKLQIKFETLAFGCKDNLRCGQKLHTPNTNNLKFVEKLAL